MVKNHNQVWFSSLQKAWIYDGHRLARVISEHRSIKCDKWKPGLIQRSKLPHTIVAVARMRNAWNLLGRYVSDRCHNRKPVCSQYIFRTSVVCLLNPAETVGIKWTLGWKQTKYLPVLPGRINCACCFEKFLKFRLCSWGYRSKTIILFRCTLFFFFLAVLPSNIFYVILFSLPRTGANLKYI